MKYLRPPKGEYSERTVEYTNTLGYKTVMWSFAYDDWDEENQNREECNKKWWKKLFGFNPTYELLLLYGLRRDI